jgi:hypothetical protein
MKRSNAYCVPLPNGLFARPLGPPFEEYAQFLTMCDGSSTPFQLPATCPQLGDGACSATPRRGSRRMANSGTRRTHVTSSYWAIRRRSRLRAPRFGRNSALAFRPTLTRGAVHIEGSDTPCSSRPLC